MPDTVSKCRSRAGARQWPVNVSALLVSVLQKPFHFGVACVDEGTIDKE